MDFPVTSRICEIALCVNLARPSVSKKTLLAYTTTISTTCAYGMLPAHRRRRRVRAIAVG